MSFYTAALIFWLYAWRHSTGPEIDLSIKLCILFGSLGSLTLVVWRVTSV